MQRITVLLLALLFAAPSAAMPADPMADDPKQPCGGYYACIERGARVKAPEHELIMLDTRVPLRPAPADLPSAASPASKP
ncbi:MAG TPA: hypothetical protein VFA64_15260 [Hyphomicrobiaceae bacterium]|nr:hypothetical protein [Hyphomicrobiaceae bacterium]